MRYSIGSVSKQITAAASCTLAEQEKLSLDDKVARWFPSLTRANEVSVRQLLNMTSGTRTTGRRTTSCRRCSSR